MESMPVVPSAVPTLPRRFRNIEILTIAYRTTPDGIARFLPEQLSARGERAIVHIYRLHDPDWFGSYGELAVHIPVRHDASGVEGSYSPMFVLEVERAFHWRADFTAVYGRVLERLPVGDEAHAYA